VKSKSLLRTELVNLNPSLEVTFFSSKQATRILGYPCYPGRIFALYNPRGSFTLQIPLLLGKYFQRKPYLLFLGFRGMYLDTSFTKKIQNPLQDVDLLFIIALKKLLLVFLLQGYLIYNIAYVQSISSRYTS